MRKVAFTQLLRAEAGLGLKEAHEAMLGVLDEQPITLEVPDGLALRLLAQAEALGTKTKCCLGPLSTAF